MCSLFCQCCKNFKCQSNLMSLLGFIQLKNFCANKTTNERFARRSNSTASSERSGSERSSSYSSSMRSSSMGSSISGHRPSVTSVQEMLDEQNRTCGCMVNCYTMCCHRQMVDQVELFKRQVISNDPSQADIINRSTTFN